MHNTGVRKKRAQPSCRRRPCLQKPRWSVCLDAPQPQPQLTAVTPARGTSPHRSMAGQEGGSAQTCSHGSASPAPVLRSQPLTKHMRHSPQRGQVGAGGIG